MIRLPKPVVNYLLPSVAAALLLTGCATTPRGNAIKTSLAPLPEAVTSFGAATAGDWLYAFGGHKGERHDYSADMVSGSFYRLNLRDGRAWEKLPASTPGQGQPLVAHGEFIYRTGGMAARNTGDEKENLHSLALVQRFNPHTGNWEDVTPLPAIRSSHDAVVLGDKLYVMGGWQLTGSTKAAVWPANALVLDLNNSAAGWQEFPQPFQRRALALAAVGTRIYCIGGMDSNNKPTSAVEIYDTATGQWSKGPDLPPGPVKGFACSAIAQNGRIYANAFQGDLLRLSADGSSWEKVGRLEHPRMAHRIVTAGAKQIIALGGEDGEEKRPELEVLTPSAKPLPPTVAEQASTHHAHE
jgi:N-acetylneuraminic acid mutarotase